ncbi:MAG TPA: hypothetical protein VFW44_12590 [Bryobacteraceae bacterium]|nr:hypothetical protein [Bryobacteraceae bacterium]
MLAHGVARGESYPALWRFVGPDAKVLIGIDWARVRQSPAGAMIREKWIPQNKLAGFPALGLLDSVERILVSSGGNDAPGDDAEDAANSGEMPILIAIQGHFEAARVRELFEHAGAKRQAYESFQVYRPQSKQNGGMAFVFFDPQTILYGQAPAVFAALDRNRYAAPPESPAAGSMAARAAALEAKYEIWAMLDAGEVLSDDGIANLFGAEAFGESAHGFEAGLNLHAGLDADFIVHFTSEEVAKRMTADISRAVAMAAKDKTVDTQAQNVARKLKFSVDGSAARISLRLNEQEFERTAEVLTGTGLGGKQMAAKAELNPGPAPAAAVAPSGPQVIRIEGLDEGPREIPYHPTGN